MQYFMRCDYCKYNVNKAQIMNVRGNMSLTP